MKRRASIGTIYRGKVGAKMRPHALRRPSRACRRMSVTVLGGPFAGKTLRLTEGLSYTLPFSVRDQVGRYVSGLWVAA